MNLYVYVSQHRPISYLLSKVSCKTLYYKFEVFLFVSEWRRTGMLTKLVFSELHSYFRSIETVQKFQSWLGSSAATNTGFWRLMTFSVSSSTDQIWSVIRSIIKLSIICHVLRNSYTSLGHCRLLVISFALQLQEYRFESPQRQLPCRSLVLKLFPQRHRLMLGHGKATFKKIIITTKIK